MKPTRRGREPVSPPVTIPCSIHPFLFHPRPRREKEDETMKRIVSLLTILSLLLCCVPALAEGAKIEADWMPYEVREFFSASTFSGWTIGESASHLIETTVSGNYFFAVAQKDGYNALFGFREVNGAYQYWLRNDAAIPQGKGTFDLWFVSGELQLLNDQVLNLGEGFAVAFMEGDNEEYPEDQLIFTVNKNGEFSLKLACFDACWAEALVSSNSIAYYHEGEHEGTVSGVLETNLRYFSWAAFPKSVKEAKESLSNPPSIPGGELSATRIKFTGGQKFEVYSGPGDHYERGANGKASVSTNDWIQVFGAENGWILIQYDLSSTKMRIGWITETARPSGVTVSPLRFAYADAEITVATFLTDDPLGSQTRLRTLSTGQRGVTWLAAMGNWVYVEITGEGLPVRGFVPASAIRRSGRETFTGSFANGEYSAQAALEVASSAVTVTIQVTGSAAWFAAAADSIVNYRLYANNVPVDALSSGARTDQTGTAWRYTFTLSATLPDGTSVLGLCPTRNLSGQRADEMIVVNIGGK